MAYFCEKLAIHTMKHCPRYFFFLAALATTLSGCSVIADIFKAGMVVGILFVVVIVALIMFLIRKMSNRN